MLEPLHSAVAANRFGLGARPGDLDRIGRQPREWLAAQLTGPAPQLTDAGLRSSADILAQGLEVRRELRAARRAAGAGNAAAGERNAAAPTDATDQANAAAALLKVGQIYRPIYVAEATARLREAVATDRPFVERLTWFWTNHFAVSVDKNLVLGLAGSLEREAIRPNVLGHFTDLLLAVERHPAMLLYLDNHVSVGPHSKAARALDRRDRNRRAGINENLAREIMELHTLGVGGGYTQTDVTAFAEVLTGWSIGGEAGRLKRGEPGQFLFRPELHEPGSKVVLGRRYSDQGYQEGVSVLHDLAAHPSTARFVATKLARHFIADEPPPRAVERIAAAFRDSHGHLPAVYRALLESPEAWSPDLVKYKTPNDYIVSTFRGLDLPVDGGRSPLAPFELLGQRVYSPGSPAGWPDRSADWDGASALLKRIEWADAVGQRVGNRRDAAALAPQLLGESLSESTRKAIARASSGSQAIALLLASPEFMRR
ncbi:MAG TPA: DUF1800 domain-containing protein [Steroidobacteraceae bacterium]|nr:DUF1800 domain-containing protein [Steroidobacteraceae bacterium]